MPRTLQISSAQKAQILKAYSAGKTPTQISMELRSIKLTSTQIANLVYKAGLTREKAAATEEAKRSAIEVLKESRENGIRELEQVLSALKDGAAIDADKLKDGWGMVNDAAGASSLQRAKGLLLNRTLKLYGLEKETGANPVPSLNVFLAQPKGESIRPVEKVPSHALMRHSGATRIRRCWSRPPS